MRNYEIDNFEGETERLQWSYLTLTTGNFDNSASFAGGDLSLNILRSCSEGVCTKTDSGGMVFIGPHDPSKKAKK